MSNYIGGIVASFFFFLFFSLIVAFRSGFSPIGLRSSVLVKLMAKTWIPTVVLFCVVYSIYLLAV